MQFKKLMIWPIFCRLVNFALVNMSNQAGVELSMCPVPDVATTMMPFTAFPITLNTTQSG